MAGKPGRSGGARPGAGRKPKEPTLMDIARSSDDPAEFLRCIMVHPLMDVKLRIDAAKALMPYKHQKLAEGGKKDERQDAAKKAAGGKFKAAPAPLKLVGARK